MAKATAGVKGYCVRCKKMVEMQSPKQEKMKNGRPVVKGACTCGTRLCRIGTMEAK